MGEAAEHAAAPKAGDAGELLPCLVCGRPGSKRCGRCRAAVYCSATCQRNAWPSHKLQCSVAKVPDSEDGKKQVAEADVKLEKKQISSEYTGVVSGKYDWTDKPENTRAPPLPVEKITEYSWRDEGKKEGLEPSRDDGDIGIYVEIPGLDTVKDEDIMFKAGGRHLSLKFNLQGKERSLHIDNLAHDITRGWMLRKKGKNRIVIKLRKKSNAIWTSLTGFCLNK